MTVHRETRRASRARAGSGAPSYRQDIEGLRAVAILLVVVYHVWIGRVSGGVDVFLMISAFFLTGSFLRRMRAGAPLAVGGFLLGRFRRLMPASSVVLAATLLASWLLLSQTSWPQLWRQGWASLGYVQNWVLGAEGVDYYARGSTLLSPLQHYWSLSIQGQAFVLWSLLFLLGALIARRTGGPGAVMAVLFGLVFVASLAFSVVETSAQQSFAYFDTRARLWEFAAGSLLAIALPQLRLGRVLRAVLGWTGLVAIVVCGMVLDVRGGFPGYLALWPILGAVLVIVGGTRPPGDSGEQRDLGAGAFLTLRPVRALGRDAYALYLVHWPLLTLWLAVRKEPRPSLLEGLIIVVASLLLARLVTICVERPLRLRSGSNGGPWRNAAVIAGCVALVAAVLVPWQWGATSTAVAQQRAHKNVYLGAMGAPGTPPKSDPVPVIPGVNTPEPEKWTWLDGPCTGRFASSVDVVQESCRQTSDAATAEHVVVVMGNSHAQQLGTAVDAVAKKRGWGVVLVYRDWCLLDENEPGTDTRCDEWQGAARDHVVEIHPDAVFLLATAASPDSPDEQVATGLDVVLDTFDAAGIPVVGVRDSPRSAVTNFFTCAVDRLPCDRPVAGVLAAENPALPYADRMRLVDFTPWICPDGTCYTVIGHIAVYLDMNHLSAQFLATLGPALDEQLKDFLP